MHEKKFAEIDAYMVFNDFQKYAKFYLLRI